MDRYRFTDAEQSLMEKSRVPYAIYQFVESKVVTLVLTRGFCDLFGYSDFEKAYYDMDNDMYCGTHPEDAARIADAAYIFATEGGTYDVIYRTKTGHGDAYHIIHARGEHTYTEDGTQLAHIWYTDEGTISENDYTAAVALDRNLKYSLYKENILKTSYYDHLTGLPGMTYFFELASVRRENILSGGGTPALMFMDFSGMKYFNHKYGFSAGDLHLQLFARIIARIVGNENCSRLGQDHFAVITEKDGVEEKLTGLFEQNSLLNDGRSLPLHVGIYDSWTNGIIPSMACDRAKVACDALKNVYSSEFNYYSSTMEDAEDKHQYIIANIDRAIRERWIKVYYQPIVRAVNGRVCDEEALARWIDPVKGFMSPAKFIPVLEDHRLIYKLDLYVVECVIQKIRIMEEAGLTIMPQSVNLSRSDFDTCDIVEEIRARIDGAGISRSMLTIEITESIVGKDFDFMKRQIDRFREYGFAVWMDDFGSGYSSLDVLQSIRFDLIKFDMRFMQQFNEGPKGRIILTELLRMAAFLDIDTICEGVETEEQVQFLQDSGCSKLQGYYYEKPIPVERILEKYASGTQIGFEDPTESQFYENIGRVSLHDLSIIAQENSNEFDNFFNTLPMAIVEIKNGFARYARSNRSYRDFMQRSFGISLSGGSDPFHNSPIPSSVPFIKTIMPCYETDRNIFIDTTLNDNTAVRSCMRRVAYDRESGLTAIAVAVLSIAETTQGTTYGNIARALAADYFNLYYVNLETEEFIEYSSDIGEDEIALERHGDNFFEASRRDALMMIYREDREAMLDSFTKENIVRQLDEQGTFTLTYRLMINDEPVYVNMKAMRMQEDRNHIIIGVSNVDMQMKQKEMLEQIHCTEVVYSRLTALSGDYICMYTVDPVTDEYFEYSASDQYSRYGLAKQGKDFFAQARTDVLTLLPEEDQRLFRELFTKEAVLEGTSGGNIFTMNYHLILAGETIPVALRAAMTREDGGDKLIVGVKRIIRRKDDRDGGQPSE